MFKKFKAMSKEKKINIEDGNAKEQVLNENAEQNATQNNDNVENKADEQNAEKADTKSADADNQTENTDNEADKAEVDPLKMAQQEVEELKKALLYKTAEFENYRKRTMKEKTELILNGGEKTISAILPVLDDFERALADKSEDPKAIKEGVQMIFNKFIKTLEGLGVKKIETADKDFDVDFHEAIAMVPGMGDDKKGDRHASVGHGIGTEILLFIQLFQLGWYHKFRIVRVFLFHHPFQGGIVKVFLSVSRFVRANLSISQSEGRVGIRIDRLSIGFLHL